MRYKKCEIKYKPGIGVHPRKDGTLWRLAAFKKLLYKDNIRMPIDKQHRVPNQIMFIGSKEKCKETDK